MMTLTVSLYLHGDSVVLKPIKNKIGDYWLSKNGRRDEGAIEGKGDMAYLGVIKSILKLIVMMIAQSRTHRKLLSCTYQVNYSPKYITFQ